ncbi:hypothetical protein [Geodermatophilus sp. URMC 65]
MTIALTGIRPRTTVRSRSVQVHDRLDAAFFADHFVQARETLLLIEAAGTQIAPLRELGRVWDPPRFARAWAAPDEDGVPYLRPYDVFDYLPDAVQRLSVTRNRGIEDLRLTAGTILQTCSGRNLGPNTIVDEDLAGFCLSHDMVRIDITDDVLRLYVLAYLQSDIGQTLLRRNRSGSVIDHITAEDVGSVPVPVVPEDVMHSIAVRMHHAVTARQAARRDLRWALDHLADTTTPAPRWTQWPQPARSLLADRLDAAYHHPVVQRARRDAAAHGGPLIGTLATARLPVRYKRYYVHGDNGRPIVSGRQLLQPEPINLRRVSDRSFKNPEEYELRAGMTIFGAVGRSEGRQAWPALVTADRDGWLASNDVMRLVPKPDQRPGALWLGVAAPRTQVQIKALSFGSVVDHMNPWDVQQIAIPAVSDDVATVVESAWDNYAAAVLSAADARLMVQDVLSCRL